MTKKRTSRRKLLLTTAASVATAGVSGACESNVVTTDLPGPEVPGSGGASSEGMGGGAEQPAPYGMDRRVLGKSGIEVSALGFGGGVSFLDNPDGVWQTMLLEAVQGGITYFDTAPVYYRDGGPNSEERFGQVLEPFRSQLVYGTKLSARDPSIAAASFEESLKKLKTDRVDILYLHQVRPADSLKQLIDVMYPLLASYKEQGVARAIGISSMESPELCTELIRRVDLDVALFSFNATYWRDFSSTAMVEARDKDMGLMVMKVVNGLVRDGVTASDLLAHAWGEPGVSSALVGHTGIAHLRENIAVAVERSRAAVDPASRRQVETKVAHLAGPHALRWGRVGYTDGVC